MHDHCLQCIDHPIRLLTPCYAKTWVLFCYLERRPRPRVLLFWLGVGGMGLNNATTIRIPEHVYKGSVVSTSDYVRGHRSVWCAPLKFGLIHCRRA